MATLLHLCKVYITVAEAQGGIHELVSRIHTADK